MTFIEACWAGEATVDDIDEWIMRWHTSEPVVSLGAFLGMGAIQYARWVERPNELQNIIEESEPVEESGPHNTTDSVPLS